MSHDIGYVDTDYLKIAAEQLARLKAHSYALMNIHPGSHVLDVGCGPGTDTIPLASVVGDEGRVVGLDFDPEMVATANARAKEAALSGRVQHQVGDALSLPFQGGSFDACRSERLFQHLEKPIQALAEMIRVTKPGGRIVVLDTDWAMMSIDTDEVETERKLARVHAEQVLRNGYAGRQLPRLFKVQGLQNISIELFPAYVTNYPVARTLGLLDETERMALSSGVITQEDLSRWHQSLEQAAANGLFFASTCLVAVAGTNLVAE